MEPNEGWAKEARRVAELVGDLPPRLGKAFKVLLAGAVALVGGVVLAHELFEMLDADEIMVVQSPVAGNLTWHTSPGLKWQGFGKATRYSKRAIYVFETPVRFNDGGHASLKGSIQYEMPMDEVNLTRLHVRFGSQLAIQNQLLETITNKSIYMTGPLMSSKESYAEKRNALIRYVEDQIAGGVYRTIQREEKTKDPMTGADKTVTIVEVALGKNGLPERQEEAVLVGFGIRPFAFAIERLSYDATVEKQIQQQQQVTMDVQLAIADAKKAEQRAITAAKQGEAAAAEAKWRQEVEKAQQVTKGQQEFEVAKLQAQKQFEVAELEARQKLQVARLDADAAEQFKRAERLRGEGEAARRTALMRADGALDKRLEAYVKVAEVYAEAIKGYQGNWAPGVVMGGGSGTTGVPGAGANQLVELLTARTAHDLSLDMRSSLRGSLSSGGGR